MKIFRNINKEGPHPVSGVPALQLDDVRVRYNKKGPLVLRGVSLNIEPKTFVSILGRSGVGKTTVLRTIAGFEHVEKGYVRVDGQLVSSNFVSQPPEKRGVGIVFQDYALFPNKTVKQNVEFGLKHSASTHKRAEQVAHAMELTNILGLEKYFPSELSGGQQQRVALARALVYRPRLLLLDEPFSNTDADIKFKMRHELHRIVREAEITTIMVTHNREDAMLLSDKIAIMCDGVVKQFGACEEVYKFPCSSDVANMCGPCNFVDGTYRDGNALTAAGEFKIVPMPASEFVNGDKLSLLIRPNDVDIIQSTESDTTRVVYRKFCGDMLEYGVKLATGKVIRVFKLNSVPLDMDGTLSVTIKPRVGAEFVAFKKAN